MTRDEAMIATSRFREAAGGSEVGTALTDLMQHGGSQAMAERGARRRLLSLKGTDAATDASAMTECVISRFLHHLVDGKPYVFGEDLIHLIAGFENRTQNSATNGLVIDAGNQPKVNQVVFDLPQSTIPDHDVNQLNLPNRNLRRSKNLGFRAGEDLAGFYNTHSKYRLPARETVPKAVSDRNKTGKFETEGPPADPALVLPAARSRAGWRRSRPTGSDGSLLVADVIASIFYATPSFIRSPGSLKQIPQVTGGPGGLG